MHATERERLILELMGDRGFVSYRTIEAQIDASPATIRRDLSRLEETGLIARVHGGARRTDAGQSGGPALSGTPFQESLHLHLAQKQRIGAAAASLCLPGEGVMIDGGTTTFQMCPYLEGLNLQVLTNSLHIVSILIAQHGTRILVPSGTVFREQNIILAPAGEESMPRFHAPKLFMGAASVGAQGIMQGDIVLVAAERRFIDRADELIVLVDSSKFATRSGAVVCGLDDVDILITDDGISDSVAQTIERAGVKLMVA
jgi:DeoR family ulaG and ulaABCDEF operon transcriptional repressor